MKDPANGDCQGPNLFPGQLATGLFKCSPDILKHIFGRLSLSSKLMFVSTCSTLHSMFRCAIVFECLKHLARNKTVITFSKQIHPDIEPYRPFIIISCSNSSQESAPTANIYKPRIFPASESQVDDPGAIEINVDEVDIVRRRYSDSARYPWQKDPSLLIPVVWGDKAQEDWFCMTGSLIRKYWQYTCPECNGARDMCPGCGGISSRCVELYPGFLTTPINVNRWPTLFASCL